MTQALEQIGTPSTTRVNNGILAHVPGQYVGRAQMSLPDAALVPHDEVSVDVDAGWLGLVRLTFRKYRYCRPKAKTSTVAWSCRHAERVTPVAEVDAVEATAQSAERAGLDEFQGGISHPSLT